MLFWSQIAVCSSDLLIRSSAKFFAFFMLKGGRIEHFLNAGYVGRIPIRDGRRPISLLSFPLPSQSTSLALTHASLPPTPSPFHLSHSPFPPAYATSNSSLWLTLSPSISPLLSAGRREKFRLAARLRPASKIYGRPGGRPFATHRQAGWPAPISSSYNGLHWILSLSYYCLCWNLSFQEIYKEISGGGKAVAKSTAKGEGTSAALESVSASGTS